LASVLLARKSSWWDNTGHTKSTDREGSIVKSLYLLLVGLLLVGAASAQTPTPAPPEQAPGVVVTQASWRKEVFVQALYDDPFAVNDQQAQLVRDSKRTIRENTIRKQAGELPLPLPVTKAPLPTTEEPSSVNYLYEAKIKNTGTKQIKLLVWVYTIVDPETGVEVGRQRFTGILNIRPGKTANLIGRSSAVPVKILSAKKSDKEAQRKYVESVFIDRLEYDDGTFWQRAAN